MSKLHNKYNRDFTVVPNAVIRNTVLSYKARGIFLYLASLPDKWEISLKDIIKHSKYDGDSSVRSGVKELVTAGYLWYERTTEHGRFTDVDWHLEDLPRVENQHVENTHVENDTPLKYYPDPSTISLNTEENYSSSNSCSELEKTPLPAPSDSMLLVPNGQSDQGEENVTATTKPAKKPTKVTPLSEEDWPELRALLTTFGFPIEQLDDNDWWNALSYTCNSPDNAWLKREFAKMNAWLNENPRKRPTTRWKSFIRGWLERAYERERKSYATQRD